MRSTLHNGGSGGRGHIRGLDGIRALAFLIVLGGHSGFTWIPNGFGVTVFFFLSGYLITTLLRKEWIQTGCISIRRFYIRRAFRILPPFFIAVIFATALASAGVTASEVHWKAVGVVLVFLTNYSNFLVRTTAPAGLSVYWSLAIEEHFYFLFPWIYRRLLRSGVQRSRQLVFFGCICFLALVWRTTLMVPLHAYWYRVYTGTDTRLDSILFGSILAVTLNPVIDDLTGLSRRFCAWTAMTGALVLIASIAMRGEMFRETVRYTIQGLALFPIFLFVIRYADSTITRFLELKVLTHIGELSYSLYLVHYIVLAALKIWIRTGPMMTLLVTFSLSYVLAATMRFCVELPSQRMRDRALLRLGEKPTQSAWRKKAILKSA
jgi:peptidoglycan/LPS O-acetylase OafA/YrhL